MNGSILWRGHHHVTREDESHAVYSTILHDLRRRDVLTQVSVVSSRRIHVLDGFPFVALLVLMVGLAWLGRA